MIQRNAHATGEQAARLNAAAAAAKH